MASLFIMIVFFIWIAGILGNAKRKGKQEAEARRRAGYSSAASQMGRTVTVNRTDPGRVTPTLKRPAVRNPVSPGKQAKGSAEDDYVMGQLAAGEGITFRGLRPGTDELEVLIRYNRAREKRLEQALESRG